MRASRPGTSPCHRFNTQGFLSLCLHVDASDDGSSDKMGDADTTESEVRIRHRPSAAAAAAETKPRSSPLKVQTPENKTYRTAEEEVSQSLSSNISAVAEELLEADSCVNESRLREPELVNEEPEEVRPTAVNRHMKTI